VDVLVSDVTYRGFTGTCEGDIAVKFDCSSSGCRNVIMDEINIDSNHGKNLSTVCHNAHGIAKNTVPNIPCLHQ
jgi:hypothetical protein